MTGSPSLPGTLSPWTLSPVMRTHSSGYACVSRLSGCRKGRDIGGIETETLRVALRSSVVRQRLSWDEFRNRRFELYLSGRAFFKHGTERWRFGIAVEKGM